MPTSVVLVAGPRLRESARGRRLPVLQRLQRQVRWPIVLEPPRVLQRGRLRPALVLRLVNV